MKTFFSGVIFLQTISYMPAKNLVGLFFAFANKFFQDPPSLNLYDLPMVYNALIF